MNSIEYFKEKFDQLQSTKNGLDKIRQKGFDDFTRMGIPAARHEEWKYTRVGGLFNKEYQFPVSHPGSVSPAQWDDIRLPGHENANIIVFINGIFSLPLSIIRSREQLVVMPLEEAVLNGYKDFVLAHFGHSGKYLKDGINALNTAFVQGAAFIHVKKGEYTEHPVYIYNITDAGSANILSQPRSLLHIDEGAKVQLVETYTTIGKEESFTNQVMEIVVEKDAIVEYYKIQNDADHTSQVSTTHIRQVGKSYVHTVTVSLNGSMVRNNL